MHHTCVSTLELFMNLSLKCQLSSFRTLCSGFLSHVALIYNSSKALLCCLSSVCQQHRDTFDTFYPWTSGDGHMHVLSLLLSFAHDLRVQAPRRKKMCQGTGSQQKLQNASMQQFMISLSTAFTACARYAHNQWCHYARCWLAVLSSQPPLSTTQL